MLEQFGLVTGKLLLHLLKMFLDRGDFGHRPASAMHFAKDFQSETELFVQLS